MLPLAPFGRTGHLSTRVVFGAAALGAMHQEAADSVMAVVERAGVNHIDTAASYGRAERLLQPWLASHRHEVFLATKTGERDGVAARAQLEKSLERMRVDQVDLIQLHNLVEPEEWEAAFAPGGAVEALDAARAEGLVRFIGVTGHGMRIAAMHLRSLERFDFDSVLLPYNHSLLRDPVYRAEVEALRELCAERSVAVQTIKSVARRRWADGTEGHQSWYEPITDPDAVRRAVHHVLAEPDLFLASTSDSTVLPLVLEAAAMPIEPVDEAALEADEAALGITPLFDRGPLELI
jgi:aryl-alcohol dehydrogenase-like predicted oxidoreductase